MINSTLKLTKIDEFSSINVNSNTQGAIATVTAGTTANIDLKLTDDHFLTGGTLVTDAANFGDSATLQVVDIDNIFGLGANKVLGQYITNWYMCSDRQLQIDERTHYPAKVVAGLYLRVVYTSTGSTDVKVAVNYRLHKILF